MAKSKKWVKDTAKKAVPPKKGAAADKKSDAKPRKEKWYGKS